MRLRLATAVAAVALASTGPSALAAEIPHDNLTRNASFEVGTTDWKPGHASVRRLAVSGAPHGSFAAEVSRGQQPRYVLTDQPDTVAATEAGAEYLATAWVKAATPAAVGKRLILRVRELAPTGTVVERSRTAVTLSDSFQELSVSATAAGAGDSLDVRLIRRDSTAGDAFLADAVTLVKASCANGQYRAQYFPNQRFEGDPASTDCVSSVEENWGEGSPPGLSGNDFGARYEGRIAFADDADYEFVGGADDGIRIWVDDELVIDDWVDHAFRTQTVTKAMTAGPHRVKVEMHENGGDARVLLRITSLDPGDPGLVPVDGGPDFYGRFSNALPTDPTFFPLAVWLPCVNSLDDVESDKDVGLNVYVGLCHDGPWSVQYARDNGMRVIPQQNEWLADGVVGSESPAWLLWDEVDMQRSPDEGFAFLDGILGTLPQDGRFRYNNYGKGVAYWLSDADAARYVNDFQDVVSADVYWYTDGNTCGDLERSRPGVIATNGCHVGANYGWLVRRVRSLVSPARSKPVWAFIEVGHPATENEFATITAPQIRSAVWHSLIAGARGIQYFNHSFGGPCISFNVLREPCGATVRPAVKALNEQITSLAPVLNAPTVEGGWVQGPDTRTMVKWHDGHLYVFMGAAGVGGTSTFTLDCVGDATATVLDEARSVPVVGGTFHDTFSDADAVHLYRIDGASSCGLS